MSGTAHMDRRYRLPALPHKIRRSGLCGPLVAAGADPEDWHPDGRQDAAAARQAQLICDQCPVQQACHDYARATGAARGSIWGWPV